MSTETAPDPSGDPGEGPGGSSAAREPSREETTTLLETVVSTLGGARREGQRRMVAEVTDAIRTRRHLLVQAGTGTGKSMGYLVPAVAHAVRTDATVVVSTATLALQAQVVDRDLPRLAKALAPVLHREPTWELLKGRANYLCRNKLAGGFPEDESALFDVAAAAPAADDAGGRLGREVVRLREWAEQTTTGDRDELDPGVSDRAWRQVSVSARECLGAQRCPVAAECFSERVRARARTVDVVVTNHAMTAIDALENNGTLLPEHDVLVVDEAHELADRVTAVATAELTGSVLATASRRLRRSAGIVAESLDDAQIALEAALEDAPPGRLTRWPEALAAAVVAVRDATRSALVELKDSQEGAREEDADARGARHLARAALQDVLAVAERLAVAAEQPEGAGYDVAWVGAGFGAQARPPSLHIAPLSVAGLLREQVFSERTVVATSATLTLGGSFDPVAGAFGLTGRGAAGSGTAWTGTDVGSPFDYRRQGILYVARRLPPPGRAGASEAMLDELAELVEAAGGRTLGLFSSRRGADEAAAALRARVSTPILCQGEDRLPKLVRRFTDEPATSLFGTLSLWQGVDVPGASCSLVVIDRIPFPRPDDPLMAARAQAVDAAGGNGFLSVSAAHAAVRLAQGAGRLIRAAEDRGVVAVLDSRLATARYGGFLRESLPGFWPTSDPEVTRSALRRLAEVATIG